MSLQLIDGPAEGDYLVHRAPRFLRGVVSPTDKHDVLDQLDDVPAPREKVYVYQQFGPLPWSYHIKMSGRHGSGYYWTATYRWRDDVDGEQLRDQASWQAWCVAEEIRLALEVSEPS